MVNATGWSCRGLSCVSLLYVEPRLRVVGFVGAPINMTVSRRGREPIANCHEASCANLKSACRSCRITPIDVTHAHSASTEPNTVFCSCSCAVQDSIRPHEIELVCTAENLVYTYGCSVQTFCPVKYLVPGITYQVAGNTQITYLVWSIPLSF